MGGCRDERGGEDTGRAAGLQCPGMLGTPATTKSDRSSQTFPNFLIQYGYGQTDSQMVKPLGI